MIRRIQKIKSFGVFDDFQWPAALLEFRQFNLIYGWNYSGKTTLSRIFRCFEKKQLHPDFAEAQAQLNAVDEKTYHLSQSDTAPVFRVFNSDFVHENLAFIDGSAVPILVLGAEDIAKQEELKVKKIERDALLLQRTGDQKKRDDLSAGIEKALTSRARDIKNQLSVPEYDKTRFEPKVTECRDLPDLHFLTSDEMAACQAVYRSTDKKAALLLKNVSLSSVVELKEKAKLLLSRVVTASKPILRLKEDAKVENWVKEGRSLHSGKDACQFCGQSLPAGLMEHLAQHFSADYEKLMVDLKALATDIRSAQSEVIALDHKADFYTELSDRFISEKTKLDAALKARGVALEMLAVVVADKQTKAFTALECPSIDDPAGAITAAVEELNKIIGEHNARTAEFENKRQEAFNGSLKL